MTTAAKTAVGEDHRPHEVASDQVDVVVIGLGVGGEMVGGKLAQAGLKVVGIEAELVGGECPYWGCIPSKMMLRSANLLAEGRRIDAMAGSATVRPDWQPVARRIREEATSDWQDTAAVNRFKEAGGIFIRGRGRLVGPGLVELTDGTRFHASRAVVLATGTRPVIPPVEGLADTPYWTNRGALEAAKLPESLLVLGGGAIGMELAQVFARFGVPVTVIEANDRLVSVEEPASSDLLRRALAADGVSVHTSAQVQRVSYQSGEFRLEFGGDSVTGERLLVSTGRRADLSALGVDTVGLDPAAPVIEVDGRMRAGERLWAVGDITGHGMFTHVATYQAGIAVRDILGEPGPPADYRALPRVTFTDPEIGAVGLTEAQAREQGRRVATGIAQVPNTARGWIHKAGNDGFIKLVADADQSFLVGATSAGPTGGEVLGALAVAVRAQVPLATLRNMIYAYPTIHRGIEDALRDLDTG